MKKSAWLALFAASIVGAAELQVGELKQHVEFGYIGTSGNSSTQTLSGIYRNDYQWTEQTDLHFRTDAYYGEQDGTKTAERYRAHAIANHRFDPKWYSYAEVGALRNTFDGFNQQYNAGLGMGYVILEDSSQLLKVRGGYQYRYANLTTGTSEDYHNLKLGAHYDYHFDDKTSLTSEWSFLEDLESASDYETVFRISLKTKMVASLSLKVGFEVKYDNTPALDDDGNPLQKTDTTTTVGIEYDF